MSKIYKKIICKGLFFVSTDKWSLLEQGVSLEFAEKKGEITGKRKVERKSSCSVIEDRNSWSF